MAHVTFAKGIESVSGTLSKKVVIVDGVKYVERVVVRNYPNGPRLYIQKEEIGRVKPTKKEKKSRNLFSERAAYVKELQDAGDKRTKKELWAEARKKIV